MRSGEEPLKRRTILRVLNHNIFYYKMYFMNQLPIFRQLFTEMCSKLWRWNMLSVICVKTVFIEIKLLLKNEESALRAPGIHRRQSTRKPCSEVFREHSTQSELTLQSRSRLVVCKCHYSRRHEIPPPQPSNQNGREKLITKC